MYLIVPVAGGSSRYPGVRPKWLLTHPNGNLMFYEAIRGLDLSNVKEVIIVPRQDHAEEFKVESTIARQFESVNFPKPYRVIPVPPTKSQPETVAEGIRRAKITGPILVKDSDNYFEWKVEPGNSVCTMNLNQLAYVDAASKSYVQTDSENRIMNIVEKQVISNDFCVGGYGFESAESFLSSYQQLENSSKLYVSHVIFRLLLEKEIFFSRPVNNFLDWGTLQHWHRYRSQFGVVMVDLDGTLVKNSAEFFAPFWGESEGLPGNIQAVNKLYNSGKVQIIITTARKEKFRKATEEQLKKLGVKYHNILFGLPHAKRILVNDFSNSNPYKSADAVNLPRDSDSLESFLGSCFGSEE